MGVTIWSTAPATPESDCRQAGNDDPESPAREKSHAANHREYGRDTRKMRQMGILIAALERLVRNPSIEEKTGNAHRHCNQRKNYPRLACIQFKPDGPSRGIASMIHPMRMVPIKKASANAGPLSNPIWASLTPKLALIGSTISRMTCRLSIARAKRSETPIMLAYPLYP